LCGAPLNSSGAPDLIFYPVHLIADHIVLFGDLAGLRVCALVHIICPARVIGGPVVRIISGSDARNSINGGANYLIDQTDYVMSETNYPGRVTQDHDDQINYRAIVIGDHITPIAEPALPISSAIDQRNSVARRTNCPERA
jgi:hypothetical protein